MHFALPPKKSSKPPVYATGRKSRLPYFRRVRFRTIAWLLGGVTVLILLLRWIRGGSSSIDWVPPGTPPIVIVTTMDREHTSPLYQRMVEENRRGYAEKHGM